MRGPRKNNLYGEECFSNKMKHEAGGADYLQTDTIEDQAQNCFPGQHG